MPLFAGWLQREYAAEVRSDDLTHLLVRGTALLGVAVDVDALLAYVSELDRWNRVYRFVRADRERLITHHILDALAGVQMLRGLGVAVGDLGSGVGLPAIPLAIALPEHQFTLIERSEKRRSFLTAALTVVGARNMQVLANAAGRRFDVVTARAVAPITRLAVQVAEQQLGRRLMVYAGRRGRIDDALRQLPYTAAVHRVHVPGVRSERHVIILELPVGAC